MANKKVIVFELIKKAKPITSKLKFKIIKPKPSKKSWEGTIAKEEVQTNTIQQNMVEE